MYKNINELLIEAQKTPPSRLAVAAAGDDTVLKSVKKAEEEGIIEPILIGNRKKIKNTLELINYNFNGRIVGTESSCEAAHQAMAMIAKGEADFPMKGLLNTKVILQAMLDNNYGLRQNRLLSTVTLIYMAKEDRLVFLTDVGMNINPDIKKKIQIIENAVEMASSIGIINPRVAILAAVEVIDPDMPETLDAAVLSKIAEGGKIKGAIVDGPFAFDNAISLDAAKHKGIDSPVAGRADILLLPDIEAGNILYKALVFYAGLKSASLIFGAKVPLVLTSRADRAETKFNSIVLGKLVTQGLRNMKNEINSVVS